MATRHQRLWSIAAWRLLRAMYGWMAIGYGVAAGTTGAQAIGRRQAFGLPHHHIGLWYSHRAHTCSLHRVLCRGWRRRHHGLNSGRSRRKVHRPLCSARLRNSVPSLARIFPKHALAGMRASVPLRGLKPVCQDRYAANGHSLKVSGHRRRSVLKTANPAPHRSAASAMKSGASVEPVGRVCIGNDG